MPLWNPMLALEMGNSKEAYDWGYAMASRYKNFPLYQQLTSPNRYTNTSVSSDIRQAMMPLWNPMLALEMGNSKEAYDWGYAMASRYKNFPRIKISDKQSRGATPAEIVANPNLQKQLRDAVNMEIASPAYNKIRESIQLAHEQYHGDQSSTFGGLFFPQ